MIRNWFNELFVKIKKWWTNKLINKKIIIFVGLGIIYIFIEVVFRALIYDIGNYSAKVKYFALIGPVSVWMFFVGGISGYLLGLLNENNFINQKINIFWQSIIGAGIVLAAEYLTGLILNVWLKLNIWDYSKIILNVNGQICLLFAVLWFLLCPFAFFIDDFLRSKFLYKQMKYTVKEIYNELFKINAKPFI